MVKLQIGSVFSGYNRMVQDFVLEQFKFNL
jgi:hypothetical protein